MPPQPLVVFTGDWHVGSTTGLCLPGFYTGEGRSRRLVSLSRNQEWLYRQFVKQIERVKAMAKGYRLFVMFGSETIDGPLHHGTTQTWGHRAEQREMAREVVRMWLSIASDAYAVTGTEAHTGSEGEDDVDVYRSEGVRGVRQFWDLTIDGRRLWWSHSGVRVGMRAWTETNGMHALANDIYYHCLARELSRPSLVVSHHVHRAPDPVTRAWLNRAVADGLFEFIGFYSAGVPGRNVKAYRVIQRKGVLRRKSATGAGLS